MKCILLAVDERPFKGVKVAPYAVETLGRPILEYSIQWLQAAGAHSQVVVSETVKDQLGESVKKFQDAVDLHLYSQAVEWLDQAQQEVFLLLDAAVFYLNEHLIHTFNARSLSVDKEPVIYSVGDRPVAMLVRGDILKKAWASVVPDANKRRFLTQLSGQIQDLQTSFYEDQLKSEDAIVIDQLWAHYQVQEHLKYKKLEALMKQGVRIVDMQNTHIDTTVVIGEGTIVYPGCLLTGNTTIGKACEIGPSARINHCQVGEGVSIKDSTLVESIVDDFSAVGPYAYLRPKSKIGKHVKIGDFVEVKNAHVGDNSKVSHLSYIGDGHVGENVNVGCGVVFVNYDGVNKHKTVIEDGAFIGCNTNLVAPVTVHKGAYVAAGSTITEDVEPDSLAIARSRQVHKIDWVRNKK